MGVVSRVRKLLALLLACVPLCVGCGGDTAETEPADEPSIGPGGPPGGGKGEPTTSPFGSGKGEKAAPAKPAEKSK